MLHESNSDGVLVRHNQKQETGYRPASAFRGKIRLIMFGISLVAVLLSIGVLIGFGVRLAIVEADFSVRRKTHDCVNPGLQYTSLRYCTSAQGGLRIVSVNVACLPRLLALESFRHRRARMDALKRLIQHEKPHVVFFQEAWALSTKYVSECLGFEYVERWARRRTQSYFTFLGSGLVIASNLPLCNAHDISFSDRCGFEVLARKGALFVTCTVPKEHIGKERQQVVLATTHLQTDVLELPRCFQNANRNRRVQLSQANQLQQALYAYMSRQRIDRYVLAGDFNIDSMRPPQAGRIDFQHLQKIFNAKCPFEKIGTYPTREYETARQPSDTLALNHCFTNACVLHAHVSSNAYKISDHKAMILDLRWRDSM